MESAERSAEFAGNFFGGRTADPRRTGRSPCVSARIRASPPRKVFRRAYSQNWGASDQNLCRIASQYREICRIFKIFRLLLYHRFILLSTKSKFLPAADCLYCFEYCLACKTCLKSHCRFVDHLEDDEVRGIVSFLLPILPAQNALLREHCK